MIDKLKKHTLALMFTWIVPAVGIAQENPDDAKAVALIRAKCVACHSASEAESDVILETREKLLAQYDGKNLTVPGKHQESLVWQLASRTVEPAMPPVDNKVGVTPLTPDEIALLAAWIDRGANWVEPTTAVMQFRDLPSDKLPIESLTVQSDGSRAAVAWGNRVAVMRIPGGEVEGWLVDPQLVNPTTNTPIKATDLDFVQALAMSSDGSYIASGGFRTFRLWKRKNAEKEKELKIEVPGPGKWLVGANHAVFRQDDGSIRVVDLNTGAPVSADALLLAQPIHSIQIHPTEPLLGLCRNDQILLTYHLGTGELKVIGKAPALPEQLFVLGTGDVAMLRGGNIERYQQNPDPATRVAIKDTAPVATIAVTDAANELVTLVTSQYPDWKPALDVNAVPNSPYAEWNLVSLNWQLQVANKRVQAAEADVKAAQEELKGEETNKQTLEGEVTKAQTALDEAKKELEAKKDDMAIAEKVKKAEGALQVAKEAVPRADERIASLKTRITSLEGFVNEQKGTAQQAQAAVTEFQGKRDSGTFKNLIVGNDRARKSWKSVIDTQGSLSLLDANNQTVTVVKDSFKEANMVRHLSDDRWWIGFPNGRAEIWRLAGQWEMVAKIGAAADTTLFPDRIISLAFSPDGMKIAIGSGEPSRSGVIHIFDVASGQIAKTLKDAHSDMVVALAFSPDGKLLASGGADRMAKIWSAESFEFQKTLEGHTHHVNSVSWNSDSRQLLTASADTTVKLWNVATAQQIKTLDLGDAELNAALFVAQADQMLVAASTQPVTRRNTSDAGQQNAYACDSDYIFGVAIDRAGERVLAGGSRGTLRVWKVDQTALLTLPTPPVP